MYQLTQSFRCLNAGFAWLRPRAQGIAINSVKVLRQWRLPSPSVLFGLRMDKSSIACRMEKIALKLESLISLHRRVSLDAVRCAIQKIPDDRMPKRLHVHTYLVRPALSRSLPRPA